MFAVSVMGSDHDVCVGVCVCDDFSMSCLMLTGKAFVSLCKVVWLRGLYRVGHEQ